MDNENERSNEPSPKPYWIIQTRRLFPHPLFAGCIASACLLVAVVFAGVALTGGPWGFALGSLIFLAAFGVIVAATILGRERSTAVRDRLAELTPPIEPHPPGASNSSKPTFAILILLVSIYSWTLTAAIHLFNAFVKNGPGSTRYYVTLGIAVTSTLFTQTIGKQVIREHFGSQGGRNVTLSTAQCVYVSLFVIACGIYLAWLVA